MFGQKPAFGQPTSTFGGFNTSASTSSPFGTSQFGKPATGTSFGASPAFGAATSTAGQTGGLFGSTTPQNTSLFGQTTNANQPTSGFGSTGFGFGQQNTSLFGQTNQSGGLFGQQQTPQTGFGAKPAGFGFGSSTPSTSLFGQTSSTGTTGLFGQTGTTMGTGGGVLFGGSTTGFGGQTQQQQSGTAHVKYNPVVGSDTMVKSGQTSTINIKHHCITCMKEYEGKSLEELRLEDYAVGRKGATGTGMFGSTNAGFTSTFGQDKQSLFGNTATGFGQPATTSTGGGGLFGNTSAGGGVFGQNPSTFSFGGAAQTNQTSSLFGQAKPTFGAATTTAGTGLFGSTTSQAAPGFGTATPSFGFGSTTNQNQSGNMFGMKPTTSGFGAPASTSTAGFGGFGTATTGGSSLFGTTTQPTFGAPQTGFSSNTFGTATSNAAGGSLFGNTGFGAKPVTSTGFTGFGQPQTGIGSTFSGGMGSVFQSKPQGSSLFPSFGGSTQSSSAVAPLGGFTSFSNQQTGGTGLGGALGTGFGAGGGILGLNNANQQMNASQSSVHEHILSLVARPYGDSPLYKDLLPDSGITSQEDALKPTNPAAQKVLLDNSGFRVSPGGSERLKVRPLGPAQSRNKKSLFEGLEESDASLECKLSLKPCRKRLVLRNKPAQTNGFTQPQAESGQLNQEGVTSPAPAAEERSPAQQHQEPGNLQSARSPQIESPRGINADLHDESKVSWGPPTGQKTPDSSGLDESIGTGKIYPSLDSMVELPERRVSWLTSKPLRRPIGGHNPEASIRDLKLTRSILDTEDKENIITADDEDDLLQREGQSECSPHPTGIKLERAGYYTIPSMDELLSYLREDGSCVVPHFTVGRRGYGNVFYDCEMDVANLDLDEQVHILNKEVIVYPEDSHRPPVGEGLNRRAIITLDRVWPRDKTLKKPITDPDRLAAIDYEGKLRRVCDKHCTKFIEYRPQTGSWVFRVEHFSKYGLSDSDEEDDVPQQAGARQPARHHQLLLHQAQAQSGLGGQQSAVGLGGAAPLDMNGQMSAPIMIPPPAAVDTSEENSNESQTLYPDTTTNAGTALGLKSPTGVLARFDNRSSHQLQLMKASLYFNDGEDEWSHDQTVPVCEPVQDKEVTAVREATVAMDLTAVVQTMAAGRLSDARDEDPNQSYGAEIRVKPLIVRPETVILKTSRQVLPYSRTIGARVNFSTFQDAALCRARHTRVGWAPGSKLAVLTTEQHMGKLPRVNDHLNIGLYTSGRGVEDLSEWRACCVQIAGGSASTHTTMFKESIEKHILNMLDHSIKDSIDDGRTGCPRLSVDLSSSNALSLLRAHCAEADRLANKFNNTEFADKTEYSRQVWRLCEALWAIDLQNGGTQPRDDQSLLNSHRALSAWFRSALADTELAAPTQPDPRDPGDLHTSRVLTLLLGGRKTEACLEASRHRDLQLSAMIAQAGGDEVVRSLLDRQLRVWESCGAMELMSSSRALVYRLLAGRDATHHLPWMTALAQHLWYICPQVSSVEEVIKSFESTFAESTEAEPDLSVVEYNSQCIDRQYPVSDFSVQTQAGGGRCKRILDLRYQLMRSKALGDRVDPVPQSHTTDLLDNTLSFLLSAWLGHLNVRSLCGLSEQLTAAGLWHLAVAVSMYHPVDVHREVMVRELLHRFAPATDEDEDQREHLLFIESKLSVPRTMILQARAVRAKYQRLWSLEAKYLAEASMWNSAHTVLMDKLLPRAVLADELESLWDLLERLKSAAARDLVSEWRSGGEGPYNYLKVHKEIRRLVECGSTDMESLRSYMSTAVDALTTMRLPTVEHTAAKCEMGARLVQVSIAGVSSPQQLQRLQLPPDYMQRAADMIVMSAAEDASENVSCKEPI